LQRILESAPVTNNKSFNNPRLLDSLRKTLYILGALILFLFALDLMVSSLQHVGKDIAGTIIQATANPFTALFIGLLVTAMIQSSSTTTSLVVAMVASGAITLQSAIPIIMGANVGTTITSTIVSLGFINKRKEFRRAVAAGTYHDFFNILTVIILFPLEYNYRFLSNLAQWFAGYFYTGVPGPSENTVSHFWSGFGPLVDLMIDNIHVGILTALSFVLLFASILLFRKIISDWIAVKSPGRFSRFFFKNQMKSFGWGFLLTAAIRSSTITTSLVVPLVAKKVIGLRKAAPFIMGANIGTTITAFIAATLNSNTAGGSIAIAHFLFNFIGVLIFFPIPVLRKVPIELANGLGRLTLKYRLAGLLYLLLTFFFIPFSLIYFNQDTIRTYEITYQQVDSTGTKSFYRIVSSMNMRNQSGEWSKYEGARAQDVDEMPVMIFPVSFKNNSLFAGKSLFLFNKPGFCWDGEDERGKYRGCVEAMHKTFVTPTGQSFDAVYECTVRYGGADSLVHHIYLSAPLKLMVKHDIFDARQQPVVQEDVVQFMER
jgi:solute carrier family 34 (sodium-dependent phosphate cotransporter)